jgi:hypothetical protein
MKSLGYIGVGILGLLAGGFVAPKLFPDPQIITLETALEAEIETTDSLRVELAGPRCFEYPGFVPSSVTPISQANADTYIANYEKWLANHASASKLKGYNVNNSTMDAIRQTLAGLSSTPAVVGTRTMFGLTVEVTTSTLPDNGTAKMLIYPLNASGDLVSLPSGTVIFQADLERDYIRPCPPHCD